MSDKPTPKPNKETTYVPPIPARIKSEHEKSGFGGSVKATTPGIQTVPMPAEAKRSTSKDDGRRESNAGASHPHKTWAMKNNPAKETGSDNTKTTPVSKRMGDASNGISTVTGYKKL